MSLVLLCVHSGALSVVDRATKYTKRNNTVSMMWTISIAMKRSLKLFLHARNPPCLLVCFACQSYNCLCLLCRYFLPSDYCCTSCTIWLECQSSCDSHRQRQVEQLNWEGCLSRQPNIPCLQNERGKKDVTSEVSHHKMYPFKFEMNEVHQH